MVETQLGALPVVSSTFRFTIADHHWRHSERPRPKQRMDELDLGTAIDGEDELDSEGEESDDDF